MKITNGEIEHFRTILKKYGYETTEREAKEL